MADFTQINSLSLGNTFGGWYAKTNEMINRLNVLTVGGITGGDGIVVTKHPVTLGGYTLSIGSNITKNVTFNGDVSVLGTLSYNFSSEISGINITVPYNAGVTAGNIVYITETGYAEKAWATDECTSEVAGIVVGFTGSNARVATVGRISGSNLVETFLGVAGATLKKGVVYFLSSGVSGAGSTLEPNTLNYVSKPVLLGITEDSGLILPFRGYKAEVTSTSSGSSSNNLTNLLENLSGISTGVLSYNGSTGYLFDTREDFDIDNRRIDGHIVGLNRIIVSTPDLGSYNYYKDLNVSYKYDSPFFYSGNESQLSSNKNSFKTVRTFGSNALTEVRVQIPKSNIKQYTLFSTSGVTSDVWRLKNIKFHIQDAPTKSFSFSLIRVINRFGGTNFIEDANVIDSSVQEFPANLGLRFGLSEISASNNFTSINGSANSITNKVILKPRVNLPFKTVFGSTTYTGDGVTAGDLFPSVNWSTFSNTAQTSELIVRYATENAVPGNGKYPIIYGRELHSSSTPKQAQSQNSTVSNRNYSWDIQSHIVGNTGSEKLVSEVLFSSMEGTSIDFSGATSGITMDTSILGWNANYGAISEGLYVQVYDTELSTSTIDANDVKKTGMIFLEMSRHDINTKQDIGTVIIPIHLERDFFEFSYSGNDLTRAGKLYP